MATRNSLSDEALGQVSGGTVYANYKKGTLTCDDPSCMGSWDIVPEFSAKVQEAVNAQKTNGQSDADLLADLLKNHWIVE